MTVGCFYDSAARVRACVVGPRVRRLFWRSRRFALKDWFRCRRLSSLLTTTPRHILHFSRAHPQSLKSHKDRLFLRFVHKADFCISWCNHQDMVGSIESTRKLPRFPLDCPWHVDHHPIACLPSNFLTFPIILLLLFSLSPINVTVC